MARTSASFTAGRCPFIVKMKITKRKIGLALIAIAIFLLPTLSPTDYILMQYFGQTNYDYIVKLGLITLGLGLIILNGKKIKL